MIYNIFVVEYSLRPEKLRERIEMWLNRKDYGLDDISMYVYTIYSLDG